MKNAAHLPVSTEVRASIAGPAEVWRKSRIWFIPYALIALAAIFFLPRLVPTAPSASDSYLFGYNNRLGILLLLFFIALGVFLTRGFNLQSPNTSDPAPLPRWMLPVSLLFVALGCAAMYIVAGRYHGFGESYYLIDRIALLDQGRAPYREIEFVYGPAQLYGPLALRRLFALSVGDAYYLFWTLSYLVGAYLLFKCVDELRFPSPAKPAIYVMLYAAGLFATIRMGTNYTFLRYALPLYFVVKLNARFRDTRPSRIGFDVLVCSVFTALLVLSSPETAVGFCFASGCLALFCRPIPLSKRLLISSLLVVAYGAIFAVAHKFHVLDAMLADGGGAINFPIVPGLTNLVYFVALFITACWLYRTFRNRAMDDPTLGLLFFSIPMIAAALGRCDPSHVFWNGLATFLVSLLYMSLFRRVWPIYALAYLLFVFLAPNLSEFYLFVPQLRSARFFDKHPEVRPPEAKIQSFLAMWPGSYVAPFGFRPDGFGTYQSSRIEYGRFEDVINVSMPHSVHQKISEMSTNPDRALILPAGPEGYCSPNTIAEKHYLQLLLLSPYIGTVKHTDSPRQEVCQYIDDHYQKVVEPSQETWWYGIWAPSGSR